MKRLFPAVMALAALSPVALLLASTGAIAQTAPTLNTVAGFAILAGQSISNTGTTVINGNIGLSPNTATSITGFPPGVLNGVQYAGNAVSAQAQVDLVSVYNQLDGQGPGAGIAGDIGNGTTYNAGVYTAAAAVLLNGTMTLDGQNNPNSVFIFQVPEITTGTASQILLINGAQAANVYFLVESSATLGTGSTFRGNIVALTSITLNTGATLDCSAWARNGSVVLDTNTITTCTLAVIPIEDVFDDDDLTENEEEVAGAIDGLDELPPYFQVLVSFLTAEELAAALAQLAGETATGTAPVAIDGIRSFLTLVTNPTGETRGVPTGPTGPAFGSTTPNPGDNTVTTMGYAEVSGVAGAYSAFAGMEPQPFDRRRFTVWGGAYGGISATDGNPDTGTQDRTSNTYGFALGLDAHIAPGTTLGFAVGIGSGGFALSDDIGGGASRMAHLGVHGRIALGDGYISAGAAYGWNSATTSRSVTLPDPDTLLDVVTTLEAEFDARSFGAQVEIGYRFGNENTGVTPYAGAQFNAVDTPAYEEVATTGEPGYALAYDARRTTSVRTELGARFDHMFALDTGTTITLQASAGWAHERWSGTAATAHFILSDSPDFIVQGAIPPANSFVYSVGTEIALPGGLGFGLSFDGGLARGATSYGVNAKVSFTW